MSQTDRIDVSRSSTATGHTSRSGHTRVCHAGLHIAADQQIYLASGFAGEILRLDSNGKAIGAIGQPGKGLGEFGEAHYMTMAPNGDIFVADTVRPGLQKFVRK